MNVNIYPEASYEVWLCDGVGRRLYLLDGFSALSFSKALGQVGRFDIEMASSVVPFDFLQFDANIQIWRTAYQGVAKLVFAGFLELVEYAERNSMDMITLSGVDGLALLDHRVNAYKSGTIYADRYAIPADNMQKNIVRQNMADGSGSVGTDRDLTAYDFKVDINQALLSDMDANISFANLLKVMNMITEFALENGEPLFFDIEPIVYHDHLGWFFVNRVNQLGADRGINSAIPTIFSKESGNLEQPILTYSAENEATLIYIGGRGGGAHRRTQTVMDSTRRYRTPWSRKEVFINYRNEKLNNSLVNRAASELQQRIPKIAFRGNLKDTPQSRYGIDWNYGDKVGVAYQGISFDAWVNAISFQVNSNGQETIKAKVELLT